MPKNLPTLKYRPGRGATDEERRGHTVSNDVQTHKLVVKFTQQQRELLERLRREGTFGSTYGEVVANVLRDFVKQQSAKGGA